MFFGVGRRGDLGYGLVVESHGSSRPFRLEPPLLPSFIDFVVVSRGGVAILCGAEPIIQPCSFPLPMEIVFSVVNSLILTVDPLLI